MRCGEHVSHAFQAPVDVHASADGQVYMFKRKATGTAVSSDEEEEDELEELGLTEMRPRAFQELEQDRLGSFHLLERDVVDGDNLNKLALQYGCKVADIKRVNNLIQEQDLFALKTIKIPVPKHSLLTESDASPSDSFKETPVKPQPNRHQVTDFLIEVDNDTEKLIPNSDDFDMDLLDGGSKRPVVKGQKGQGADWGIQWWNAVVAMLLIGIVLPLFYVIYFKTQHGGEASPAGGSVTSSIASNRTETGTFGTGAPEPG
ncbi:lysM and putative peptidoglycan-binding domain-containing protein 4 [Hippocampus comes]|uniref:LysM and putative peptidoglycan-binding domain-containing protein 4 n=1 Tax=Hippocampus comes TaxID=109280 RepID=A0A3Q2XG41_HIPCM|nr:PREDICTED: lysM and putative peptidoglycan-binding domain-containing protein 4-like [Hippocampus comes]XP_019720991.1 PREDICTED: lysM and putative peptidoglycan-binding domain-containing protein 4-like [Hippocampus comes]XP_019720992.1 PREDICTED: lysM and putative peptidoglycan-binding domain-containing protein 4-like [Hippocampus comes]XP_019720993.1 PREDICTED: lysM and putative peptidoglycan-binding domain-containing protein 4-like [Hippocampus comes]